MATAIDVGVVVLGLVLLQWVRRVATYNLICYKNFHVFAWLGSYACIINRLWHACRDSQPVMHWLGYALWLWTSSTLALDSVLLLREAWTWTVDGCKWVKGERGKAGVRGVVVDLMVYSVCVSWPPPRDQCGFCCCCCCPRKGSGAESWTESPSQCQYRVSICNSVFTIRSTNDKWSGDMCVEDEIDPNVR